MNFNFGVQQQLATMTFDVAYVGSLNRHLPLQLNLNPIPIYSKVARRIGQLSPALFRVMQTSTQNCLPALRTTIRCRRPCVAG